MQTDHADLPNGGEAHAYLGSNQSGMRAHNERLVLSLIRQRGPLAKAEIARASGLSAQTVSVIMRALEADGFLIKGAPVRGKVGQPSVPMRLAQDGAFFLGLKIGRRSVELVLIDFLGKALNRIQHLHDHPTPAATIRFAHQAIEKVLAALPGPERARVAGLGIAMPFQMWDWATSLGLPESDMADWRDADIKAEIAARYAFPVYLKNDASAACGAELVFGTSETPTDFLYFYVGYFIGGGVVLNGRLYTGQSGNAGALGSLPVVDADGSQHQLIDVASLSKLERALTTQGHDTSHIWLDSTSWEVDPAVLQGWIAKAASGIAQAIASACSVIGFEVVMIDGWFPPYVRTALVDEVSVALSGLNLAGLHPPEIREGTIGPDARALGAASLPLSERFLVEQGALPKPV